MPGPVHILKTGSANLASVVAAIERLGMSPVLTSDPTDVWRAERLVLPGVGAFAAAMASLRAAGLVQPLRDRLAAGKSTLCICLGLQLLAETSEESPGTTGLGIVPARVTRFAGSVKVPQLGWNTVTPEADARFLGAMWAYYANSYKLDVVPQGWSGAMSVHGMPFVGAIERGNVLACQFHPELSGAAGLALIERWASGAASTPSSGLAAAMDTAVRVIPCLDVRDGRVVKGVKFQNLRDAGDPATQAAEYERQGADELVMLDVSATPEGRATSAATIKAIRRVLSIPLTVGGGVRTEDDAGRLLDAGADKVGVNTAAVKDPTLLTRLATRFGRQCVVLAIDAASTGPTAWEVVVQSGKVNTGKNAVEWAVKGAAAGAGEILLTSYDRDGTGEGYDLDLLRAICSSVRVPVIASGGAKSASDLSAAIGAGASAVLAATIFHDGHTTVDAVKRELAATGASVRLDASMPPASMPSSLSNPGSPC
ncbi:MAG: imidazole glycerol phosphate synthase subunit HisH [Planctomycetota bacterium]